MMKVRVPSSMTFQVHLFQVLRRDDTVERALLGAWQNDRAGSSFLSHNKDIYYNSASWLHVCN